MIQRRNEDDEPDVIDCLQEEEQYRNEFQSIDLTQTNSHQLLLDFPIRPPSPFADRPVRSSIRSSSANEPVLCSSSHATNTWRRTLNKFFKHTKGNKHKKATTTDLHPQYGFSLDDKTRSHSSVSRGTSTNKRVHWIDDDDLIINASQRFLEHLKIFVEIVLEYTQINDDYIRECQIALNELNSLIDCQKINVAFDDLIQLAIHFDKYRLSEQHQYIKKIMSQTVVFSSA